MAPGNRGSKSSFWRGKRQGRAKQTSNPKSLARYADASRNGAIPRAGSSMSRSTSASGIHGASSSYRSVSSPTNYLSAARSASGPGGHHFTPINAPRLAAVSEERTSDELGEVVMAVDMRDRGTVGCCYYVAAEETLYFMEDVPLGNVEIIDQLKLIASPTVVLLSTSASDDTMSCLDPRYDQESGQSSDAYDLPYVLEMRPPAEFKYDAGRDKLIGLHLGTSSGPNVRYTIPGDASSILEGDNLHSWIDIDSRHSVGCANAVLIYLQRKRSATYIPHDPASSAHLRVTSIAMFGLQDTMIINTDTALSLQLMVLESHPAMHNQGPTKATSGSKEGLSVYGLFHPFTCTPQGKHLLRQYFLRPSKNVTVISERLDSVACLSRPENETSSKLCRKSLKAIGNVRSMMIQLKRGISAGSGRSGSIALRNWSGLLRFTFNALQILESLGTYNYGQEIAIFTKIRAAFVPNHFTTVGQMISEIVDFEESRNESRAVVRVGIDSVLDEKKRLYAGLEDLLREVALEIAQDVPEGLPTGLNVAYFPQIGFLITMPMDKGAGTSLWEGSPEDPWEKMFSSELQVYYKSIKMRDMDDAIGDVYTQICDREIEILHGLAERIVSYESSLVQSSDLCGELDCLLALAQGACQHGFNRPRITEMNQVIICSGWHPLQKLTCSTSFVPNDTCLAVSTGALDFDDTQDSPSMVLLTGPNYSGKSVYLKQVAIVVYLAHIGSFVPAASATIGLTDAILTRVSTRESVSTPHSAFMTDLLQMSRALRVATPRSLLVIDEFGKGTGAHDGAGLAAGVFAHLSSRGSRNPKVLAATHFHEIFETDFLQQCPDLSLAHMEACMDEDEQDGADRVTYLYNLRAGRSNESFGTQCAAMSGISEDVVRRARDLADLLARGDDLVVACGELAQGEVQELLKAEQLSRAFVADDLDSDPQKLLDELFRPETAFLIE